MTSKSAAAGASSRSTDSVSVWADTQTNALVITAERYHKLNRRMSAIRCRNKGHLANDFFFFREHPVICRVDLTPGPQVVSAAAAAQVEFKGG